MSLTGKVESAYSLMVQLHMDSLEITHFTSTHGFFSGESNFNTPKYVNTILSIVNINIPNFEVPCLAFPFLVFLQRLQVLFLPARPKLIGSVLDMSPTFFTIYISRVFSSSLLHAIIACNHMHKIHSIFNQNIFNFCTFLPNFQYFGLYCPFFALFLKNYMHVLTF